VGKSLIADEMPIGKEVWGPFITKDYQTLRAYSSGTKRKELKDYLTIL
jgi:hypothetical protein